MDPLNPLHLICPFPRPLPSSNHQLQNKKVMGLKSTAQGTVSNAVTILYATDGDGIYCGEGVVMHKIVKSHITDLKLMILCVNDTSIKTNEMKYNVFQANTKTVFNIRTRKPA